MLAHAASYDFFCDDAFITLRYAEKFAAHGAPVYNLGERVEGYTSPLWMSLAALGAALGLELTAFVRALGALSGVALLASSWHLFARMRPGAPFGGALVLFALAAAAPVAAWTLGGLETPLFAALVTLTLAGGAGLASRAPPELGWRPPKHAAALALLAWLTTLARPEGALVALLVFVVALAFQWRRGGGRRAALWFAAIYGALLLSFVALRYGYYGDPLPNTFHLKSSGDASLLRARGLRYAALAASELGVVLVGAIGIALALPVRREPDEDDEALRRRRALVWMARALVVTYVPYVVSVGGDFLDLYRFFVPLMPIAFAALVSTGCGLYLRLPKRAGPRWTASFLALALLAAFAWQQQRLRSTALAISEPARAAAGVEPLGWTRLHALRWAAMGRWIASMASPGDWMAVGAAGAMPFYAGISNLDTFGLNDAFVAKNAPVVGDRPGHQRFAPLDYILSKEPVFLLIGNDYVLESPAPSLRRDPVWERRGYVWAEATLLREAHGAPGRVHHYFLLRRDRAEALRGRPHLRTAIE